MKITLNGKEEALEKELTLLEFLKKKNIRPEIVAVEMNKDIVDKAQYKSVTIKNNDTLEIIQFIGGG